MLVSYASMVSQDNEEYLLIEYTLSTVDIDGEDPNTSWLFGIGGLSADGISCSVTMTDDVPTFTVYAVDSDGTSEDT